MKEILEGINRLAWVRFLLASKSVCLSSAYFCGLDVPREGLVRGT